MITQRHPMLARKGSVGVTFYELSAGPLPPGLQRFDWLVPWPTLALALLTAIIPLIQYYYGRADAQGSLSRRALSRKALRRYRSALIEYCSKLALPFRIQPVRQVNDIYVPLRAISEGHRESNLQIDAETALAEYRSVLLVGPPGSGKSMLLKQAALTQLAATRPRALRRRLPIYLELSRLNEAGTGLKTKIAERLGMLAAIDRPELTLQHGLDGGHLMLLLDGLDEVVVSRRPQVAQEIRDLLDEYRKCWVVVTCRASVYDHEIHNHTDRTFRVEKLDNDRIRQFLSAWLGSASRADLLMSRLLNEVRILELVRNPLLLTLLAHLYADEVVAASPHLPASRAEFYREATQVLLLRWRQEQHTFSVQEKREVLERLALWAFDHQDVDKENWPGMPYKDVVSETAKVLPTLNRDPRYAREIIDEIVVNSSVLNKLEAGDYYQFSHHTLQEYFAASALRRDPDDLLRRYQEAPDTWREPLLLWCGEALDATYVIRRVYELDPQLALECLEAAERVDPVEAQRIIDHCKARLLRDDSDADVIARALGTMAAGRSQRAQTVRGFLIAAFEDGVTDAVKLRIADALAETRLPEAAELLVGRAHGQLSSVSSALIRMGDVAVPFLLSRVQEGDVTVLDILESIGTPTVAKGLVPLLWIEQNGNRLPVEAAWRLTVLLKNPSIRAAIDITSADSAEELYPNRSRAPSNGEGAPSLSDVTARINALLRSATENSGPSRKPPLPNKGTISYRIPSADSISMGHGTGSHGGAFRLFAPVGLLAVIALVVLSMFVVAANRTLERVEYLAGTEPEISTTTCYHGPCFPFYYWDWQIARRTSLATYASLRKTEGAKSLDGYLRLNVRDCSGAQVAWHIETGGRTEIASGTLTSAGGETIVDRRLSERIPQDVDTLIINLRRIDGQSCTATVSWNEVGASAQWQWWPW